MWGATYFQFATYVMDADSSGNKGLKIPRLVFFLGELLFHVPVQTLVELRAERGIVPIKRHEQSSELSGVRGGGSSLYQVSDFPLRSLLFIQVKEGSGECCIKFQGRSDGCSITAHVCQMR
jgi:hypothetical protein